MKNKIFIVGIVIGVFIGVIASYGVSALTMSTAMDFQFGEFEKELLNYLLRAFKIVPYLRHSDFQFMVDYLSENDNVVLVAISKVGLREKTYEKLLPGEEVPVLIVSYENKTIYFRERDKASGELRFYYWSP